MTSLLWSVNDPVLGQVLAWPHQLDSSCATMPFQPTAPSVRQSPIVAHYGLAKKQQLGNSN